MFTSRAEFRTLLRQDNADIRLTELSYNLGLASSERMEILAKKRQKVVEIESILTNLSINPEESLGFLNLKNSSPLLFKQKAAQLLLRPSVDISSMIAHIPKVRNALSLFDNES
jgi:tRNA uridine 5-carboxymethylaminomethyl modification enzyme